MKEKTYRRMTRRSPVRGLKLFKSKYLTKNRFYALLATLKLVHEVKEHHSIPVPINNEIRGIELLEDKIKTDRGVFNLSYRAEAIEIHDSWYYKSIFSGKTVHTVSDAFYYEVKVEVRSECLSFWIKLDPFSSVWVERTTPYIHIFKEPNMHSLDPTEHMEMRKVKCDFFNTRLAKSDSYVVEHRDNVIDTIFEVFNRIKREMVQFIELHPDQINERLCGVKYDGQLHTEDGCLIEPYHLCRKCGRPVFSTKTVGYKVQCICCNEDLYGMELEVVDPKTFQSALEFYKRELYDILTRK